MRAVRVEHMVWSAVLGARALFLLPTSASDSLGRSGRYRRLPPYITRRNYVNRLDTWNVIGINDTTKREEVVDIFKEEKFELFALTETKLKLKERYHRLELISSLPVPRRWKELGEWWPSC